MTAIRTAEILSVGTELLLGEIVDTNSATLAASLAEQGVDVLWSQRVGDNVERIAAALGRALERSDLVVLTGGLGPTDDDLTRDAVARVVGEEPRVDPDLEAWLRGRFASFGRRMPERNLRQAERIPSSEPLPNPIGTAPGWLVRIASPTPRVVVTLPGPPRELERMWRNEALPRLHLAQAGLYRTTFKTHGVGESDVAERLGDLTRSADPSVATYAKRDGVHVRIAAKADDLDRARTRAAEVEREVEQRLGTSVWGRDEDELPELVVASLRRHGRRLALVELASAGTLSETLGGVPGAAEAIGGSVIAWAPETMASLGIATDVELRVADAATEWVAAVAAAIRALFGTEYGLAIGPGQPIAGDGADGVVGPIEDERAATRVVIAIAADGGGTVRTLRLPPLGAAWMRERLAFASLFLLRSVIV